MKIFITSMIAILVTATTAFAYTPVLSVTAIGTDQFSVNIYAAAPNSTVDLYTKQSDSDLWTIIRNFGSTDNNGSFNQVLSIGTFRPELSREFYVIIGGVSSPSVIVQPYYTGNQLSFSSQNITLNSGQTQTVNVYGSNQRQIYVSSNSNTYATSVTINDSNSLVVRGDHAGSSTIRISTYDNLSSGTFNVTVTEQTLSFMTTSLPQAMIGEYYNQRVLATGGSSPYHYSISSGSVPYGLALTDDGWIYGTPTYLQQTNFEIRATDALNRQVTKQFVVSVTGRNQTTYRNGQLVIENGTIYQLYKNQRIGFANMWSFNNLGFKLANVEPGYWSQLPQTQFVVNTSYSAHPWGSWVKSGNTVYFVHETGLIPITTYEIFLNNGGLDKLVVPINWYDGQLAMQPFMTYNDSRLIGLNYNQQTKWVRYGENFVIQLESNPSTGYQWNANYDISYLKLVSRTYQPYNSLVGSAGLERFEFQPVGRGQTTINFDYRRSWETVAPLQKQTYQVIIQ